MSLMDNSNMYMPVVPANGNGSCGWGDNSMWMMFLFFLAIWGNNGFGGWGGNGMMPYMMGTNTNNDVQRGFDQQALTTGIAANTTAINSLAQGQCAGFAGVNNAINTGFAMAENAAAARQMAGMQQAWNAQTAIDARIDALAMNQQNSCFENRQAVADLKYTMANESAATRANTDAKVQNVMDKLCQLEKDTMAQNYENRIIALQQNYDNRIAGMQSQIDALRTQVSNDRFDASQNAQTAAIQAGQRNLANEVEQYVLPTARPAYVVPNPNCCPNSYGWNTCGAA